MRIIYRYIQVNNQKYTEVSPLQTMLLKLFVPADEDEARCEKLSSAEILSEIKNEFKNVKCDMPTVSKLGKVLTTSKFVRVRKGDGWLYIVKRV